MVTFHQKTEGSTASLISLISNFIVHLMNYGKKKPESVKVSSEPKMEKKTTDPKPVSSKKIKLCMYSVTTVVHDYK